MKKIFLKTLLLLLTGLLIKAPVLAIDLTEYGDFSSRSTILNEGLSKDKLTQEQKDLLSNKKLAPTTQCLVEQIKKGNIENVRILLNSKVNPNSSYLSEYPIYTAAKNNKFEIVKLLIEYGAKTDKGFYSELYISVKNKNSQMAQYLIEKKARLDYVDTISNNTILYMALKNNMIDTAQLLIDRGVGADIKSAKLIKKKKLFYLIKDKI